MYDCGGQSRRNGDDRHYRWCDQLDGWRHQQTGRRRDHCASNGGRRWRLLGQCGRDHCRRGHRGQRRCDHRRHGHGRQLNGRNGSSLKSLERWSDCHVRSQIGTVRTLGCTRCRLDGRQRGRRRWRPHEHSSRRNRPIELASHAPPPDPRGQKGEEPCDGANHC